MPKKLMDCVKRVMDKGKSKSDAFAICIKSTGLKPHKRKKKSDMEDRMRKQALGRGFEVHVTAYYTHEVDAYDQEDAIEKVMSLVNAGRLDPDDTEVTVTETTPPRRWSAVIKRLVQLADQLDQQGLAEEADAVDQILEIQAQKPSVQQTQCEQCGTDILYRKDRPRFCKKCLEGEWPPVTKAPKPWGPYREP